MAGPFARIITQLIVPVIASLARAIPAAYGQALRNARATGAASEAAANANPLATKQMPLHEALQVLNFSQLEGLSGKEILSVSCCDEKRIGQTCVFVFCLSVCLSVAFLASFSF